MAFSRGDLEGNDGTIDDANVSVDPTQGSASIGDVFNETGFITYGSNAYGGLDPRGKLNGSGDLYDNTIHGVDITVNDWIGAGKSFGDFDAFSASVSALESKKGTQEGWDGVRALLDAEGFRYSSGQIEYWALPQGTDGGDGGGGGGGGGGTVPDAPDDSVRPPDDDSISPIPDDDSTNDGSDNTQEDNNSVIESEVTNDEGEAASQEQEENDDDDSLLTVRDVTPEDEVVDPITGTRYPSPEDARRSGITNWVYAHEYQGG